jgi:hypothetical protein
MKKLSMIFLVVISFSFTNKVNSIDCSVTSVGFTPVNDLGPGYFRGFQGGLYPGGSNTRPVLHNKDGVIIAHNIVPLDTAGNYDPVNGKVVLLSVGMSNTSLEFTKFMSYVSASPLINPKLVVVNGAQGGKDINLIVNPLDSFWTIIKQKLAIKGVTVKQVQAVWFKETDKAPTDTAFLSYTNDIKAKFKTVMNIMKTNYVNLKLCYNNSRIYAGYATSLTNPEPYAYYNGWTVKWMIEDQISGDTSLVYKGVSANSPWLSWGAYVWADGILPRLDGLTWVCSDFNPDGTHPDTSGIVKVASRLFTFFSTDETTKPWFLKNMTVNIYTGLEGFMVQATSNLRMKDSVFVNLRQSIAPFSLIDYSSAIVDSVTLKGIYKFYNAAQGSYYFQVKHRNSIETWSRAGGENLIPGNIYNYDFTGGINRAFGNNQVLKGNKYCFYGGEVVKDGVVDLSDIVQTGNDSQMFETGYADSDVNGDMLVDLADVVFVQNNSTQFVTSITP